jgi:hypothetical protein
MYGYAFDLMKLEGRDLRDRPLESNSDGRNAIACWTAARAT